MGFAVHTLTASPGRSCPQAPLSSWYNCGPETGSGFNAPAFYDSDRKIAKYKRDFDGRTPKCGCSEPLLRSRVYKEFTSMTLVVADDEGVTTRNDVGIQVEVSGSYA